MQVVGERVKHGRILIEEKQNDRSCRMMKKEADRGGVLLFCVKQGLDVCCSTPHLTLG